MQLLKHILESPVSYMLLKYYKYLKKTLDLNYLRWSAVIRSLTDLTPVTGIQSLESI